jgi:hypothetical protein
MPRPPSPLPPELGLAFSNATARAAGVTAKRLRARDLEAPFHGARLRRPSAIAGAIDLGPLSADRAERVAVLRNCLAYRTVAPAHTFFAGRTAAVLWGLPLSHGDLLEVGVHDPVRAPRGRGIHGIKVRPAFAPIRDMDGLRLTSPAATWAMLGRELDVRELIVVGDAVVRVPRDERGMLRPDLQLATIEQLRRAVDAGARRGVARLRDALDEVRVGSASPLETEYRLDAASAGLPEPTLDTEIRSASGALLGITEVAYPRYRTLVEIEGDHHRTDQRQWDRDIEKYAAYVAEGWEVVRITARHIRGRDPRAVEMVSATLTRRGWAR